MLNFKKILTLLLAGSIAMSFSACSSSDENPNSSEEISSSSEVSESSTGSESSQDSSNENTKIEIPIDITMPKEEQEKIIKGLREHYDYDPADVEKIKNMAQGIDKPENAVEATISTTMGDIDIILYPDAAPLAVENFVGHAMEGYYNGLKFHRVIEDFMIQTGDPEGNGTGGRSIWINDWFRDEFNFPYYNYRGAISMANRGPNTNGSQFFIVQSGIERCSSYLLGDVVVKKEEDFPYQNIDNLLFYLNMNNEKTKLESEIFDAIDEINKGRNESNEAEMDKFIEETKNEMIQKANAKLQSIYAEGVTDEIVKKYMPIVEYYYTVGGAPHLDNIHTVFGYVTKGMDVVDAIAAVETDEHDMPVEDVLVMNVKIK